MVKDKHNEQKWEGLKLSEFSPEQMEQRSKLKQMGMSSLLAWVEGGGGMRVIYLDGER